MVPQDVYDRFRSFGASGSRSLFGAADESARVHLNGRQVAIDDLADCGWDRRIDCDITRELRVGKNQLTIRVPDRVGPGGLWKSIKNFASR